MFLTMPMSFLPSGNLSEHFIAHGGGIICGKIYTNSYEAVVNSLKKGYKYIELDMMLTVDSQLVCMHSFEDFRKITAMPDSIPLTEGYFKKQHVYGRFVPLTVKNVVALQKKCHFTLVTDKTSDPQIIDRYFSGIRKTVMVEAFSIEDYVTLKGMGYTPMLSQSFRCESLWRIGWKCIRHHVDWISTTLYAPEDVVKIRILKRLFGIHFAVYPTNPNPRLFRKYIGKDIDLIYVDDKDIFNIDNNSY
ncbi:glycerophosphodiester phosphodiesterase family protein [Prevotella sp. tf2-5]|uniref:glycerophosphodiester phosphodiesterase family protein n=1 Tax=Prevotella sp. tf2-5 TaxID=1761889 RepID=UPI0008EB376B|nr:glycerophosphodiester phosphodiesterase family protein [Prevotella sp. tf2-5]SFO53258.1 Glycerophosphoryl diester phosphodiesterase family protein [Prevotella sp. tf2-5]